MKIDLSAATPAVCARGAVFKCNWRSIAVLRHAFGVIALQNNRMNIFLSAATPAVCAKDTVFSEVWEPMDTTVPA